MIGALRVWEPGIYTWTVSRHEMTGTLIGRTWLIRTDRFVPDFKSRCAGAGTWT